MTHGLMEVIRVGGKGLLLDGDYEGLTPGVVVELAAGRWPVYVQFDSSNKITRVVIGKWPTENLRGDPVTRIESMSREDWDRSHSGLTVRRKNGCVQVGPELAAALKKRGHVPLTPEEVKRLGLDRDD